MKTTKNLLLILAICISIILFLGSTVSANTVIPVMRVSVEKKDGTENKYAKLQEAINAVEEGDTIKILDTDYRFRETVTISGKNGIKFDFCGHEFEATLDITNSNITFLSGIYNSGYATTIFNIKEGSTITFDGGQYKLGQNNKKIVLGSNSTAIFKNDVHFEGKSTVTVDGENSKVLVEDGYIKGNPAIKVDSQATNTTISISKDSEVAGNGSYYDGIEDKGKQTTINIDGTLTNTIHMEGEGGTLNLRPGSKVFNSSNWPLEILGNNNTINITDSTVKGGRGGILVDSSTTKINIENSTVEGLGTNYPANIVSPAIVAKSIEELNIKSGTIKGEIGIIALDGNVNIDGGQIIATNTDQEKYTVYTTDSTNISEYRDINGAAVIINDEEGKDAKATITGGTFSAATDNSLISVGNKDTDYEVSGGIYNKPFNANFVVPEKLEITVGKTEDDKIWYVGNDANNIVEQAKKEKENIIDVLQGNLTIKNATTGLTLKNSGNGNVNVNGINVKTGEEVISEPEKVIKPQEGSTNNDKNNTSDKKNGLDSTPKTGGTTLFDIISNNSSKGNNFIKYIVLLSIVLVGFISGIIIYNKNKNIREN